jgi:hypothetical protein
LKRILMYAWSSPVGVVGLFVEVLFRALGWVAFRNGRSIIARGRFASWMHARGWNAVTIGWTVVYWVPPSLRTVFHEERHVWQVMHWGVLLPFAYGWALLVAGYRDNPFEVDARDYAERMSASFLSPVS